MTIQDRLGAAFDANYEPGGDPNILADRMIEGLSEGERDAALTVLIAVYLIPSLRAAYSKASRGQQPHHKVNSAGTLTIPLEEVEEEPAPGIKNPGKHFKVNRDFFERAATVNGVPLMEASVEDFNAELSANAAKAEGYLRKNQKLAGILALLQREDAASVSELSSDSQTAVFEIWTTNG